MFGFSLAEFLVVLLVALVVIGPKDLPKLLRKLGQYAGKLRRMAGELRAQSGIDDALRSEGLADDIAEIRKLARGEIDSIRHAATVNMAADGAAGLSGTSNTREARSTETVYGGDTFHVPRDREYPRDGADSLGALPDNAFVYGDLGQKSALASDPLYAFGDEDASSVTDETRQTSQASQANQESDGLTRDG